MAMLMCAACGSPASGQDSLYYSATALGQFSTGDWAPYFIGSLNGGLTARANTALAIVEAHVNPDLSKRFTWSAGAELVTGYSSGISYSRYEPVTATWSSVTNHPSAAWIQQLYGQIKYRGVFLRVGQKQPESYILDESLSSGDLTRSRNSRGIPGAEIGFIDFQNVPFTKGYLQIQGVIEYGRMTDDGFNHDQFNYYNSVWTSDLWYTYKRCYFRVIPSQSINFVLGMQTAGQFGGSTRRYSHGNVTSSEVRGFKVKDIFRMFFPLQGDTSDGYYEGNSLGSWDFKATVKLADGHTIEGVFEWPWEDGSGIGHRNGWDGLYGIYYHAPGRDIISGAAVEYFDFRNHSGAIHWAPGDRPGTTLIDHATGGDDYYNNETYGAYTNYGLSIGSPVPVSTLYNTSGYPLYSRNRCRAVNVAITGYINNSIDYAVKYSWQQAWGNGRLPQPYSELDNSILVTVGWDAAAITPGLRVKATAACDAGLLRGNNFGAQLTVSYTGSFIFKKTER